MREDVALQMEEVDPLDLSAASLYDPSCTHTHISMMYAHTKNRFSCLSLCFGFTHAWMSSCMWYAHTHPHISSKTRTTMFERGQIRIPLLSLFKPLFSNVTSPGTSNQIPPSGKFLSAKLSSFSYTSLCWPVH